MDLIVWHRNVTRRGVWGVNDLRRFQTAETGFKDNAQCIVVHHTALQHQTE